MQTESRCMSPRPHCQGTRPDDASLTTAPEPAISKSRDFAEQVNELVEAGPELEVVDEGARLRVRMQPALQVAALQLIL